ncbi:MAG: serine/threonine protein kinase, partial [Chitinophagaceae bacterium]|nr:serine/threonine protein kinase [Rubrivivax sp.]
MNIGDADDTPAASDMDAVDPPTRRTLPVHALPSGTRIRDYQIIGLLGEGGFGIVYLATDVMLERAVAVKEYLPTSIAGRAPGTLDVAVRVPRDRETFDLGMKSFVNEARLLARFDHPALLKVLRFWEENGTAYMAMPFYEGRTLQRVFERLGRPPDEAELRAWLWPLLDALQVLHTAQCFHRDIAPDNILITAGGPLLLDFGAARRVIGDAQRTLTVVLKPGFAPIEQYGESGDLHQGAWTDIYALAGVLYAAITGRRPVPAAGRLMEDHMLCVRESAAGRYSEAFLQAIDMSLALRPRDRPQSIAEFRMLLDGRAKARLPPVTAPVEDTVPRTPREAIDESGVDLLVDMPDTVAAPPKAPVPAS